MKTTPDEYFSEDRQGITYREDVAPMASVLCGFFGLLFLAVSIAFFFEIATWPWHGGKVMGLLTVLAFACFGSVALLLGIAGMQPQHLRFNRETRRMQGRRRGRLWLLQSIDLSFDALQRLFIKASSREMDSDLYEVRIEATDHQPLALGSFEDRAKAEHWQERLMMMLRK